MTHKKLLMGAGVLVLLFSSCHVFRYFTGECPLGCARRIIRGEAAPAKTAS
jgi:hypothetical protein